MRTTATNRKLRLLLTAIRNGTLIPRPEFQRRLVWSNKHKLAFLQTVLMDYPFPEIYIASGEVNPESGEGTEMLVDGQQRIDALYRYFIGSSELKLGQELQSYAELPESKKIKFLEYDVVIRDLGKMSIAEIKEVFKRINSTNYALNAMEIHNARFDGEFKNFGEEVSQHDFFDRYRIFSTTDIRRMQDLRFVLICIVTMMSTYFNRDEELESYLDKYNDEFNGRKKLKLEIDQVLNFIDQCKFNDDCRVWKKADLFTLLIEVYRALIKDKLKLNPTTVGKQLTKFYNKIDSLSTTKNPKPELVLYSKASIAATNDRSSRISRGKIIKAIIGV